MLQSLEGVEIHHVPHATEFDMVQRRLGDERLSALRADLNRIIDEISPNAEGLRTFSSSFLGSQPSPWPYPLLPLYDIARAILGDADEQEAQDRAALFFGLFVWDCIMNRDNEDWVFYDPNLDNRDPNREITGKVYFERIG